MKEKRTGLIVLGFSAGFASAFLGIGGGVVLVPMLVFLFAYDIKRAIGTSLATIVPAALVGAITHFLIKSDNILFIAALVIIPGALAGAKLGTLLAHRMRERLLKTLFAFLLVVIGLKQVGVLGLPAENITGALPAPFFLILGLVAGISSALFGIGGGVVMVPGLSLLFGFSMHQAIATSLTVIVPTAAAGAFFHAKYKNTNVEAIKFLIPAALCGAVLGAILSNMLSSGSLQMIFGCLIIILSVRMFFQRTSAK